MKPLLLNLWAWIVAHPAETMTALYLALNAINKAIPVNASKTSRIARWLDIACVLTQRGAVGATSWPVVGRSIAREIVAPERETQAPPPPRESEPGYAESRVLAMIALASLVALVAIVTGCSAPEQIRRSVEPLGLYEVQHPLHGSCHEVGVRAQSQTLNRELVVYGGVCVGRIDAGVVGDAGGE